MARPYYRAGKFDCRNSLGYLIRKLGNLIIPSAEELFADEDISFTQWVTLMGLREGLARTPVEVARHLNHDPGATTRLIDQLEARGLVTRCRSRSDRRVVELALTSEGRAMAEALRPRVAAFWNRILKGFSHEEIDRLIATLNAIAKRLEAASAEAEEGARNTRAAP